MPPDTYTKRVYPRKGRGFKVSIPCSPDLTPGRLVAVYFAGHTQLAQYIRESRSSDRVLVAKYSVTQRKFLKPRTIPRDCIAAVWSTVLPLG